MSAKQFYTPACSRLCAIPLFLLVASCATGGRSKDESLTHRFEVKSEEGIPIAVTKGGPKYTKPIFTFEEAVRLEQDESREETLLVQPTGYFMGEDGNFFVMDAGDRSVAVYGSDGKYKQRFGREGSGPGEFRYPRMLWLHQGRIAIYDQMNRRTSLFQTDGTFLESFSHLFYMRPDVGINVVGLHPAPDDRLVRITAEIRRQPDDSAIITYIATVTTTDGDTLSQITAYPHLWEFGFWNEISAASYRPGQGILVYITSKPEFTWYGLDGNPRRIIRVELDPEPVTGADRRTIERMLQKQIDEAEDERSRRSAESQKESALIPEIKSYWYGVWVDDAGYLWLRYHPRYTVEGEDRSSPAFRVLSPEGEYLGDATWPEASASISRGHLLTFREDEETGLETLIVYRIEPAVPGLTYP